MRIQWTERQQQLAVAALCLLVYVPLAGCYGMGDPWETHYGEIARQMAARNDWISLWWPCSPQDRPEVFHKPVLHFWLMALSLKLFGFPGASPSEMVDSWRVEWACRLPNILLSVLAIVSVWTLVKRLGGARTAWWTAAILATSSQWVLVTRQAMTNLPFVAPMTAALAFAGLALHGEDKPASKRALWLFHGMFTLVTFPQLLVISLQLKARFHGWRLPGVVPMLPYLAAFAVGLWWRPKTTRSLYLSCAWVLAAVASLAKGPAGLAMPGLVLVVYLVVSGRAREILRLELGRGLLLFAAVAFPWYHAMSIRHGAPFWRELIGDNYVHRAEGRHGDRGGFDYYLQWLLYATFPWTGVAAAGIVFAKKRPLAMFALVWIAIELTVLTLVNTKFHHYVLPILPAVAILAALMIEEIPKAALLVAAPLTLLAGRDLAAFPARLLWLFNYDYVNVPGSGRPWPQGFDYAVPIVVFTVLATVFTVWGRRWLLGVALAWSLFIADKVVIELSPHWSQKQVIAAYYRLRKDEPLVVWQLYWRGENFYTRNEIYGEKKTVVMDDGKKFLAEHHGQKLYFLVERAKYPGLQRLVPGLQIVDDSNNKLYLAVGDAP